MINVYMSWGSVVFVIMSEWISKSGDLEDEQA